MKYLVVAIFVAMIVFILAQASDIKELKQLNQTCTTDLVDANVAKLTKDATIDLQNAQIKEVAATAEEMRKNGKAAVEQATRIISEREATITALRRSPKATTSEEVRIKLLKYAGVEQ